jgi:hypothetical protein
MDRLECQRDRIDDCSKQKRIAGIRDLERARECSAMYPRFLMAFVSKVAVLQAEHSKTVAIETAAQAMTILFKAIGSPQCGLWLMEALYADHQANAWPRA